MPEEPDQISGIQAALALEAFLNMMATIPRILGPQGTLYLTVSSRARRLGKRVPASTATLGQMAAAGVLTLTVPLILCVPRGGPTVAENRRLTYKTLAAGEASFITYLCYRMVARRPSGFTPVSMVRGVVCLVPRLSWHYYALYVKPELLVDDVAGAGGWFWEKRKYV